MAPQLGRAMAGQTHPALEWGWLKSDYKAATPRRFARRRTARIIRRAAYYAILEGLFEILEGQKGQDS
jgi:hypothetical protein